VKNRRKTMKKLSFLVLVIFLLGIFACTHISVETGPEQKESQAEKEKRLREKLIRQIDRTIESLNNFLNEGRFYLEPKRLTRTMNIDHLPAQVEVVNFSANELTLRMLVPQEHPIKFQRTLYVIRDKNGNHISETVERGIPHSYYTITMTGKFVQGETYELAIYDSDKPKDYRTDSMNMWYRCKLVLPEKGELT